MPFEFHDNILGCYVIDIFSLFSLEWFISLLISCCYPRCNIWQLNFQVKDFMEKSIRRLRLHLLEILKDNSWSRLLEFKKSDWMRLKCCSRCILIISLAKKAPHKNHKVPNIYKRYFIKDGCFIIYRSSSILKCLSLQLE